MQRKWYLSFKELKLKMLNEKETKGRDEHLTDSEEVCSQYQFTFFFRLFNVGTSKGHCL